MKATRLRGFFAPLLAAALGFAACGDTGAGSGGAGGGAVAELRSSAPHLAPHISSAERAQAAADAQAFAFDLYREVVAAPGAAGENVVLSPLSLSVALSMAAAGARGPTLAELRAALRVTQPEAVVDDGWNAILGQLSQRPAEALAAMPPGLHGHVDLAIVDRLFAQLGMVPVPAFLDTLSTEYDAGIGLVDFAKNPDAARKVVNTWVEEATSSRIVDLLPPASVDESTKFVLVNAISVSLPWPSPFAPPVGRSFTRLDGHPVVVPTLEHDPASMPYVQSGDLTAAALPLLGGDLELVVVLPDEGKLASVEASLDGAAFSALRASMQEAGVVVRIPKLHVETASISLRPRLEALGVKAAFDPDQADFLGMTESFRAYLVDAVQKAVLDLDEAGLQAYAATGVLGAAGVSSAGGGPPTLVWFEVDRPFLFVIRDRGTGALLFVGRVTDPS